MFSSLWKVLDVPFDGNALQNPTVIANVYNNVISIGYIFVLCECILYEILLKTITNGWKSHRKVMEVEP